jgi:hypothetical protein
VLHIDQIQEREGSIRLDLDKDVDITVRTIVIACARAKMASFETPLPLMASAFSRIAAMISSRVMASPDGLPV